jgi:formylglycine-generating enzyme required for sulfatase activity
VVNVEGFFIARTPVTNGEFALFVAETGHWPPRHWHGSLPPSEIIDHPVVHITWRDALAYAEWRGMRLPTEEEWEKAARGIDGRVYPWGDTFVPGRCNTRESGTGGTTSVGCYSPDGDSPCGCADMEGNIWEWTASEERRGEYRVVRGGSFLGRGRIVRAAVRYWGRPGLDIRHVGVRLVADCASLE